MPFVKELMARPTVIQYVHDGVSMSSPWSDWKREQDGSHIVLVEKNFGHRIDFASGKLGPLPHDMEKALRAVATIPADAPLPDWLFLKIKKIVESLDMSKADKEKEVSNGG